MKRTPTVSMAKKNLPDNLQAEPGQEPKATAAAIFTL